jgi:hypothetical protein
MERLTERILLSVTSSQRAELQARAKQARLTLSEYLRRKALDLSLDDGAELQNEPVRRINALERRVDALERQGRSTTSN